MSPKVSCIYNGITIKLSLDDDGNDNADADNQLCMQSTNTYQFIAVHEYERTDLVSSLSYNGDNGVSEPYDDNDHNCDNYNDDVNDDDDDKYDNQKSRGPPGPDFQAVALRAGVTSSFAPFGPSGRVTHASVQ